MAHKRGTASRNPFEGESAPEYEKRALIEIEDNAQNEIRVYELTSDVKERYEKMVAGKLQAADAERYDFHWEGDKLCVEAVAFVSVPIKKLKKKAMEQMGGMSAFFQATRKGGSDIDAYEHLATQSDPRTNVTMGPVYITEKISIQERADKRPMLVEDEFSEEPIKAFSNQEEGTEIDTSFLTREEMEEVLGDI